MSRKIPITARRTLAALAGLIVLLVSSSALAVAPCVRENGCTVPACVGAPPGGAVLYYVCDCNMTGSGAQQPQPGCLQGNDALAGTSPATAWRTYSKAQSQFGSLNAGDRILFCNGGVFSNTGASTQWVNFTATNSNRVALGAYTATWGGGAVRPRLMNDLNTYNLSFASGVDSPKGGYNVFGLSLEGRGRPATPCASSAGAMDGVFIYNQVNHIDLCDMAIYSQCNGIEAGGGNSPTDDDTDIQLQYTYLEGNGGQGWLGGGTDYLLDSNWYDNNGFEAFNTTHNLYVGFGNRLSITNSDFTRNTQFSGGGCDAAVMVFHGLLTDILVEGNRIFEVAGTALGPCYGIGVNPGYVDTEQFLRVTIRRNVIQNVGGDAINVSACHNCVIEDNIIQATSPGVSSAVVLSDDSSTGSDWHNDSTTMRNNVGWGLGANFKIEGAGTNMVSANNFAELTNTGTVNCFNYALPNSSYAFIDNNGCEDTLAGSLVWNQTGPTSRATMCSSGFDCNSLQGVAPLFTNARLSLSYLAAGADFTPTGASPLRHAGSTARGSASDFFGVAWVAPPAIGAVQGITSVQGPRAVLFAIGGFCLLLALGFGLVWRQVQRSREHERRHLVAYLDKPTIRELRAMGSLDEVLGHLCGDCGKPLHVPLSGALDDDEPRTWETDPRK